MILQASRNDICAELHTTLRCKGASLTNLRTDSPDAAWVEFANLVQIKKKRPTLSSKTSKGLGLKKNGTGHHHHTGDHTLAGHLVFGVIPECSWKQLRNDNHDHDTSNQPEHDSVHQVVHTCIFSTCKDCPTDNRAQGLGKARACPPKETPETIP